MNEGMSRKENPQKLTQLSSRSHPRHLVGKRTAQKDTTIDTTSDSQVNSNFPYRWTPASLTFNNYFYLFLYFMHQFGSDYKNHDNFYIFEQISFRKCVLMGTGFASPEFCSCRVHIIAIMCTCHRFNFHVSMNFPLIKS